MDFSYKLVPTFDDTDRLEQYLIEIESYSQMFNINISELISYSLLKSQKVEILSSLNQKQRSNLDEFAKFLRSIYGEDSDTRRYSFANMRQSQDEDYVLFFQRIKTAYYALRGLKPPNTISEDEAADLRFNFITRIRNDEVRQQLVLEDVPYSELPTKARRLETILKSFNKATISEGETE